MVPKVALPGGPSDYRPMIVRHLHRILVARLENIVEQNGFRRGFDGVAANGFMLDSVLRCAWRKHRDLCAAVLDVRKAFDSVSHTAIARILRKRGLPARLRGMAGRRFWRRQAK